MKKQLLFATLISTFYFGTQAQDCNDLFFSEYVEGSGNNKALEVYNPTNATINLSTYSIVRYSNGQTTANDQLALTGSIAAYDVHVVVNGQTTSTQTSPACDPTLQAMADQLDGAYPAPTYMNGNDALTIEKSGVIKDIFGKIGEDPGDGWGNYAPFKYYTKDHTLLRKSTVKKGVSTNPGTFTPSAEWDSLANGTWTNLGSHTCDCQTTGVSENTEKIDFLVIYPNPVTQNNITVKATDRVEFVEVFDITGKKIMTATNNDPIRGDINLKFNSELTNGIYFVKATLENKNVVTKKFTVK